MYSEEVWSEADDVEWRWDSKCILPLSSSTMAPFTSIYLKSNYVRVLQASILLHHRQCSKRKLDWLAMPRCKVSFNFPCQRRVTWEALNWLINILKRHSVIQWSSFYTQEPFKSQILAYSDFALESCAQLHVLQMLHIVSCVTFWLILLGYEGLLLLLIMMTNVGYRIIGSSSFKKQVLATLFWDFWMFWLVLSNQPKISNCTRHTKCGMSL